MTEHPYVEAARQIIEQAFNQGNYAVLRTYFPAQFTEHQFGLHATIEGMQRDIESLRRAFPDFQLEIEETVVDGDRVWIRSTARGTNLGGFMGPPNGKSFAVTVFDQLRFQEGQVVEHWGSPDRFALLSQLGLLPGRPQQPKTGTQPPVEQQSEQAQPAR